MSSRIGDEERVLHKSGARNQVGYGSMKNTLEKLERLLEIASREGIAVRCEWLGGVRGGLARIGHSPILFVDESLTIPEQFDQVREALNALDWTETEWWDEISNLLEVAVG